jgi:hypothetical protein
MLLVSSGGDTERNRATVFAENLINLTNVELAAVKLLPFPGRARPYINLSPCFVAKLLCKPKPIALRHQLTVLQRKQRPKRVRLNNIDRLPTDLVIAMVGELAFGADYG